MTSITHLELNVRVGMFSILNSYRILYFAKLVRYFWGLSLSENNEVGGYPVGGGRV